MRHHFLNLLFGFLLSCSLVAAVRAAEPGDWDDPSWQLLREAHIHRDAASLAAYLRDQCGADADLRRIDSLIHQLSSPDFTEREQASKSLVAIGPAALSRLRAARNDPDAEVSQRAKEALARIGDRRPELTLAAVRVLIRRGGAEAVPTLLRLLPYADFEELQDDLWFGLDALTVRQGKIDASLTEALHDPLAVRRAVAACIVGRRGDAEQRGAVRKLLTDADAEVRLRAAQGLLAAKDASGVATLTALLEGTPMETAWQAEELLRYVAGDEAPHAILGAGAADDRRACQKAWEAWWKEHGPKVDLAKLDGTSRRPGLMLLCDGGLPEEATGRAWLLGCDGVSRWELRKLSYPVDARLLAGGRVLIAEGALAPQVQIPLAPPPRKKSADEGVSMRELGGKILWRYQGIDFATLCQPMPNGNLFVAGREPRMAQVSMAGLEVSVTTVPSERHASREYPRPLLNNHILYRKHGEDSWHFDWMDFDPNPRTGPKRVLTTIRLWTNPFLLDFGAMETLDVVGGPLAGMDDSFVVELAPDAFAQRKCSIPGSFYATKVRNGDILVGGMGRVVELDGEYKLVWSATFEDQAYRVRPCLNLVRLGFDERRPTGCDAADAADDWLRGLKSRDARVRRRSAKMVGAIGPVAIDAIPALNGLLMDSDAAVRVAARVALAEVSSEETVETRMKLKDSDPKVRMKAISALAAYRRDAKVVAPPIMELLDDQDPKVRGQAATILGAMRLESRIVVPALIKAARDDDPEVRRCAVASLGQMHKEAKAAIPVLLDNLKSKNITLRGFSATALGEIDPRDERVFPALIEAIQGKELNDAAAYALSKCGPRAKEAVPILLKALEAEDKQGLPERIISFRSVIIQALGQIGPDARAAVPALVALAKKNDRYQGLQLQAVIALGRIGPAAKEATEILDEMQRDRLNPYHQHAKEALQRIHADE
jgi:HEAT repeat protein